MGDLVAEVERELEAELAHGAGPLFVGFYARGVGGPSLRRRQYRKLRLRFGSSLRSWFVPCFGIN